MSTSSRRLAAKARNNRPSHTPGKTKAESCQRSPLKTFGMNANPYKLKGAAAQRYEVYCKHVDAMNKGK